MNLSETLLEAPDVKDNKLTLGTVCKTMGQQVIWVLDMDGLEIITHHTSGIEYDSLTPEWSDAPFPQPKNGHTVSENIEASGVIKRKFCFPAGQIPVSVFRFVYTDFLEYRRDILGILTMYITYRQIPGDVIKYTSYECVIILPLTPTGCTVDELLKGAFKGRKLFYIGRDIHRAGFSIQSAYQLLPG